MVSHHQHDRSLQRVQGCIGRSPVCRVDFDRLAPRARTGSRDGSREPECTIRGTAYPLRPIQTKRNLEANTDLDGQNNRSNNGPWSKNLRGPLGLSDQHAERRLDDRGFCLCRHGVGVQEFTLDRFKRAPREIEGRLREFTSPVRRAQFRKADRRLKGVAARVGPSGSAARLVRARTTVSIFASCWPRMAAKAFACSTECLRLLTDRAVASSTAHAACRASRSATASRRGRSPKASPSPA